MKSPLLLLSIALVLILFGALGAPYFIDWPAYRPQIEAQLSKFTGTRVTIGKVTGVRFLPSPVLELENIAIAGSEGSGNPPVLSARTLKARLHLTALLSGRFHLTGIELIEPRFNLDISAEGLGTLARGAGVNSQHLPDVSGVDLDQVIMRNGLVTINDKRSSSQYVLRGLNAVLSASTVFGPLRLNGDFVIAGQTRKFKIATGRFNKDKKGKFDVRLHAQFEPGDDGVAGKSNRLAYVFDGDVGDVFGAPSFKGQVQVTHRKPRAKGAAIELQADIAGDLNSARLDKISIVTGADNKSLTLRGQTKISWYPAWRIVAGLRVNRINLDDFFTRDTGAQKPGLAKIAAWVNDLMQWGLKKNVTGTFVLDAGNIMMAGKRAENVGVTLKFLRDWVFVQRALANFPGHTQATVTGTYRPKHATQRFAGTIAVRSLDARSLVRSFLPDNGNGLEQVIPRAFNNMTLKGTLTSNGERLHLASGDIKLGQVSGKVDLTYALAVRPQIGMRLDFEKIDADALLATSRAYKQVKKPARKPGDAAKTDLAGLAGRMLGDIDIDAKITLGRLIYHGVSVRGFTADLGLKKGRLEIRQARVDDIAGAKITAIGALDDLGGHPHGGFKVDINADELNRLADLFAAKIGFAAVGAKAKAWSASLSPAKLQLSLGVGPGSKAHGISVSAQLNGHLAASRLSLETLYDGVFGALATGNVSLQGELTNDLSDKFLAQFGIAANPSTKPHRGLLRSAINGRFDKPLELALGWQAYGVQGTVSGTVKIGDAQGFLAAPTLETSIDIKGEDGRDFLKAIGSGPEVRDGNKAGVALKGLVAGSSRELVLTGFRGEIGGVKFDLDGTADFAGVRPLVRLNTSVSRVSLPWIVSHVLAVGVTDKTSRAAGSKKPRKTVAAKPSKHVPVWPIVPVSLEFFNGFDGDITARVERFFITKATAMRGMSTQIGIKNGVVRVNKIAGVLLDGQFTGDGIIKSLGRQIAFKARYQLRDGRLETLFVDRAGDALAKGRFVLKGDVNGQGHSVLGIMSSLAGDGVLKVRNGVLRGVNPETFQRALSSVHNETELDGFIKGILIDGEMAFSAIDSAYTLRNGLMRMADMSLEGPGAKAHLISFIDLGAYRVDSEWRFTLSAFPKAPAVTLIYTGPLNAPERAYDVRGLRRYLVVKKLKKKMHDLEQLDQSSLARRGSRKPAIAEPGIQRTSVKPDPTPPARAQKPAAKTPQTVKRKLINVTPTEPAKQKSAKPSNPKPKPIAVDRAKREKPEALQSVSPVVTTLPTGSIGPKPPGEPQIIIGPPPPDVQHLVEPPRVEPRSRRQEIQIDGLDE